MLMLFPDRTTRECKRVMDEFIEVVTMLQSVVCCTVPGREEVRWQWMDETWGGAGQKNLTTCIFDGCFTL
jgi:hypothetical protein